MTRGLATHAVGDIAYIDGPHGCFDLPKEANAIVMFAGGIGVAPFVSLLGLLLTQAWR
ncbi:hypothetical protein [Hydrogenophaga sp.]|uniref:hypothetical protein n=1 Tax=Hydrogenophaga sp. TaxID=1904254 RepID=UPI002724F796|nr:hypothetical protein [Hydrogenophaga sp.]MDO9132563.1 hypothetical protein [Hydrogenophaga sp.]MDZ4398913.1 hypothetical protein [Hydrogenophaga sp.]